MRKKFRIVTCDDRGDPNVAGECAVKLADQEKVTAVVGPLRVSSDVAVRGKLAEKKVLQLSLAGHGPPFERPATYFRVREDRGELTSFGINFITQTLKPKRLAVISAPNVLAPARSWAELFPSQQVATFPLSGLAQADVQKAVDGAASDAADAVFLAANMGLVDAISFARRVPAKKIVFMGGQRTDTEVPGAPNLIIIGFAPPVSAAATQLEKPVEPSSKKPPSKGRAADAQKKTAGDPRDPVICLPVGNGSKGDVLLLKDQIRLVEFRPQRSVGGMLTYECGPY